MCATLPKFVSCVRRFERGNTRTEITKGKGEARVILIIPLIKGWGKMREGNSEKLGMVLHCRLYSRLANFAYFPLSSIVTI